MSFFALINFTGMRDQVTIKADFYLGHQPTAGLNVNSNDKKDSASNGDAPMGVFRNLHRVGPRQNEVELMHFHY